MAGEPTQCPSDGVLRAAAAPASGDQTFAAAKATAETAAPASGEAHTHGIDKPHGVSGLASADPSRLAGRGRKKVLRLPFHPVVVLALGALVVIRCLGLGEEDRRLVERNGFIVLGHASLVEEIGSPLDLRDVGASSLDENLD